MITGGAGLLGSHLVPLLLDEGAIVRVVDRIPRDHAVNLMSAMDHIDYIEGDLRNPEITDMAFRGTEIVFHLAARVAGAQYVQLHDLDIGLDNARIDVNVFESTLKHKPSVLLYASTGGVYDKSKQDTLPTSESQAWRGEPVNLYGMAKLLGERLATRVAERIGTRLAIVRLFSVYGPGEDYGETSRVIPDLIRKILLKEPFIIWGDGSQIRNFLYVADAANALVSAVKNISRIDKRPINIGSEKSITIKELALMLREISPYPEKPTPIFDPSKPLGAIQMIPDISAARASLDWRPKVPLEEGLRKTFDWYRNIFVPQQ